MPARVSAWLPANAAVGFIVAVVTVAVIAYFSLQALQARAETSERVARTITVMEQLQALLSLLKDAETGQRGFLLTGEEPYLKPYENARAKLPNTLQRVGSLIAENQVQQDRLAEVRQAADTKLHELDETIQLQRRGDTAAAMAVVKSDRGLALMERIRVLVAQMIETEQAALTIRQLEWQQAITLSSQLQGGGSLLLLVLIGAAAVVTSRDYRARETQIWLRAGHAGLSLRLQGEQRLDVLGDTVLRYLASYLDAKVGALYLADASGGFQRIASFATTEAAERVAPGHGLLGQTARNREPMHVRQVPAGYLPIASTTGRADASELLIAPAIADGSVEAVVELGFFRRLGEADVEMLTRMSELLGISIRSSKDRTRLEELLEETQRQAEELQAQQEELRVSNEELEEQGRALKESQAQLEVQQSELEQTNSQLEEQTQLLEAQRDELAQSQEVLSAKAVELERINQYKSEFLANMSHELRTPLNSTLILAKLLADNKHGNLTPEQVKFASTISSAGNDLLTLINDILDLAKIESGNVELDVAPVQIAAMIESILKTLQPVAQQRGLRLHAVVEPDAPATIDTDAQRLGQILKNLMSNALKFTDQGEVELHVNQQAEGMVTFAVRDTGIGIAADQQRFIFDAFRQADGSTHRKYGGTGLGLSISRDLAHLLGGDITLQSAPGEGSVFSLTLPLSATAAPRSAPTHASRRAAQSEVAEPPASGRTLPKPPNTVATPMPTKPVPVPVPVPVPTPTPAVRQVPDDRDDLRTGMRLILVIEDDVRFAAILRDLTNEMAFQCIVTHSATEGLQAAATFRPSAILLDMNLPDHSGLGVLDQLKRDARTRHIPVHVLSVADYIQQALERGAIGYDLKPVKREQLEQALHRLEAKFMQRLRRVLVVEDDDRQRESITQLLATDEVEITGAHNANAALDALARTTFDCMIMDLNLPDLSGYELLERMSQQEGTSFPPVIVYTGRSLSAEEEQTLRRFSKSIIIKDARSPERLLDEVTLFLHQVESTLPAEAQRLLKLARDRDTTLDGRRILVVEDDVRNVFALTSVLEPKGVIVELARNGRESLDALARSREPGGHPIDLVLMDIMMPEMDGFTAMREIRKQAVWKKLPIIALTAKAMKNDQEQCLAAGANDYIAKPLDVERLLSLVRVWMPK